MAGLRSASAHLLVHEHECHGRGHVAHRVGHRAHHLSGRTVNRPSAVREIGAPCDRYCRRSTQPHAKQQPTSAAPPLVLHPRLPPDKPAHDHTHTHTSRSENERSQSTDDTAPHRNRHTPSATPTRERARQGNHRLRELHRPLRQRLVRPLPPLLLHLPLPPNLVELEADSHRSRGDTSWRAQTP